LTDAIADQQMSAAIRVAIGIPTRNRAELARHAIQSIVEQRLPATLSIDTFVSDNSTVSEESAAIEQVATAIGQPPVVLIRPPDDLPMVEHWNFLLTQMLRRSDADYFLFLTDRMFFKRDALRALSQAIQRRPHSPVITYGIDTLHDLVPPYFLRLRKWSGQCVRVSTAAALNAASRGHIDDYLPRMLNSAAHRSLLQRLTRHYGSVFASVAPDFAFCFRALSLVDHYTSIDQSLIVQHGLGRSNGRSMSRGVVTPDSHDFMARLAPHHTWSATPIPELQTTRNVIMNEYAVARANAPDPGRFPPIDLARYMELQWSEVLEMEDPAARDSAIALLRQRGDLWPASPYYFDKAMILERAASERGARRRHPKFGLKERRGLLKRLLARWRKPAAS
jgi:hypothetical protein